MIERNAVAFLVLAVFTFYAGYAFGFSVGDPSGEYPWPFKMNSEYSLPTPWEPVACTMEAKMCPDGSSVGRVGPNCEFAPCS